jgi:inositol transport system ATP-binding protein
MLRVEGVSKSFWGIQALDRVDLSVEPGTVHAVTGENGAGKSTLMKIIAGLFPPDSGEIRFSGRAIAMIHQELMCFPALTVAENIFMGREPSRFGWIDQGARHRRAGELLAQLGLSIDPATRMSDLTVAGQQSVEIAKALRREADLIIMDEPTSALSDRESELLFRIIGDLKRRGAAILYISHRMPEIFRLADTITVMRDGRHIATEPAAAFDEQRLIALMVGRKIDSSLAAPESNPGETILEVRGLSRPPRFRDISLALRRGEILGLAGLMGAGRTDVASAIFGLAPATSGEIYVHGRPVRIQSPAAAMAHGIAMVTEDRKKFGFVPEMSIQENVTLSALSRYCRGPFLRRAAEGDVADRQIARFAIRAAGRRQRVMDLSGGNQQKVALARALLTDPEILILDEPTRGIDVGAKSEIYGMIAGLAKQGKAILLISSELNEILSLSHRIVVMREGSAVAGLLPAATNSREILRFAMPN